MAGSRSEVQATFERRIVERAREWQVQKERNRERKKRRQEEGRVRKRVYGVIWKVVVGRLRGMRDSWE